MVQVNFARKTIDLKLVYYGPGLSGKTTNLDQIHRKAPDANCGDLTSIDTNGDRTLFFDYMPLNLGVVGMETMFQLYTVPGQVFYNATRKLVLQGADGIVFVADSAASKLERNLESFENLAENLAEHDRSIAHVPLVFQWNKRDLDDALPVEELEQALNPGGLPSFEAIASESKGVFTTLKGLAALVLQNVRNEVQGNPTFSSPV